MKFLILLYVALPAFAANMAPVLAQKYDFFPRLDKPIDFGKKIQGKRIFGDHKTFRGFAVGIAVAIVIALLRFAFEKSGIIFFPGLDTFFKFLFYGFLSGFGALSGDAVESFLKRQFDIPSGRPFVPFDQIDYMLGFFLCTALIIDWSFSSGVFLLVVALVMNPLVNITAYLIGVKKTYW